MKRGLILINAYSKLEHSLNQSTRLKEELELLGVKTDIKRNNFFATTIDAEGNIESLAQDYDFCIYLDKDKYVSFMLEKTGLRLFNSHFAIEACDDKMITSILLANQGIPLPKTMPGLLCYDSQEKILKETLDTIEARLHYPIIAKTSYGSLGKGVFKMENRQELEAISEQLKCMPHLYQEFIASSYGRDIRVIVIGEKYVTAMIRQSNGDFRSNLELGGVGTAFTPPQEVIAMCEKVAHILQLDYCGIDVLFGKDQYYICEVNSNAFFGGIERVTNQNIAHLYAQYIVRKIYKQ